MISANIIEQVVTVKKLNFVSDFHLFILWCALLKSQPVDMLIGRRYYK